MALNPRGCCLICGDLKRLWHVSQAQFNSCNRWRLWLCWRTRAVLKEAPGDLKSLKSGGTVA
jgi:hypothetical protein